MGMFSRDRAEGDRRNRAARHEVNGLLGAKTHFEGTLDYEGNVRVDGHFKGTIRTNDVLIVGEGGDVEGEFDVGEVVIMGKMRGSLRAREIVRIHPTGKFHGTVLTPALAISEGALFEATCRMEGANDADAQKVTPISSRSAGGGSSSARG